MPVNQTASRGGVDHEMLTLANATWACAVGALMASETAQQEWQLGVGCQRAPSETQEPHAASEGTRQHVLDRGLQTQGTAEGQATEQGADQRDHFDTSVETGCCARSPAARA